MKKIITLVFSAGMLAALGISFNACAPSTDEQNTTTLLSAPSNVALTRADSAQSSAISLSCGCPFGPLDINSGPLMVTGYGDTSKIRFSFKEPLSSSLNVHTLSATIFPSTLKTSGSSSSWIALYFLEQGMYPLYDTVFVTATY